MSPSEKRKLDHIVSLAKGFLPADNDPPQLNPRVRSLLGDDDDEVLTLSLRQIRNSNLEANAHTHTWAARTVPSHKFSVGDLGYITSGGDEFKDFVLICNILRDGSASFPLKSFAYGEQWCWKDFPMRRQQIHGYELPWNVSGCVLICVSSFCELTGLNSWPVAVAPQQQIDVAVTHSSEFESISDAWRWLLDNSKRLAKEVNVNPDDLILSTLAPCIRFAAVHISFLVTRAGTDQDFYIHQFGHLPGVPFAPHVPPQQFGQGHNFGQQPRFGQRPNFGQPSHFPVQVAMPKIFYLFTSLDEDHEPYWSSAHMCVPRGVAPPPLERGYTYKIGYTHGFLQYVQLHADDFTD